MEHFNDIMHRLGSIEGKQDIMLSNQSKVEEDIKNQTKRIDDLENSNSRILGIGAGVMGLWALVSGFLK